MNKRKDILWRIYLVFFLVSIAGLAIVAKAFKIQITEGQELRALAQSLTVFPITVESERGNVFSEDGRLLATSLPFFEIRMDFLSEAMSDEIYNNNVDSLAWHLANHFGGKTKEEYLEELHIQRRNGARYYLIKRKATYAELQEMQQWPFFRLGRYKSGLIVIQNNKRVMPFGELAHRTIGYVRDEGRYKVGLEGKFDNELTGAKGQILVQKIAGGTLMPLNDRNEISAKAGQDIYTTLDINMQDVVEDELLRALERHGADHGCAVLMEVGTGKIKAIANLGLSEDGLYHEKYNYAIGEATEPGSTFKTATMMALLEDGYININKSINLENGEKAFHNEIMKDSKPPEENDVSIRKAFAISSNVALSKLAFEKYDRKRDKFYNHLVDFGLNQATGIEIVGEPSPTINSTDGWSGVSVPWISVGYEVQLTPLQILTYYNAIANNGKMMRPYLVSAIKEYNKNIEEYQPQVIKDKICSKGTLQTVRELLEAVVEEGTAKHLYDEDEDEYKFAGKTGTAKIVRQGSYTNYYQASFAGYFPADNPRYSCIVVINQPTSGYYYGSSVAAPVFKAIADKVYAADLDIHTKVNHENRVIAGSLPIVRNGLQTEVSYLYETMEIKHDGTSTANYVKVKKENNKALLVDNPVINTQVPDVRGMGLRDALYLLENAGLKVKFKGKGKVKTQSVRAGTPATKGRLVEIQLG